MYNRLFNFLKSIFYIWIYLLINQIFIYYLYIKLYNINFNILIYFLNQDLIIRYFYCNIISLVIIFLFLFFKIYIFKDYNFVYKITFMYSKLFNYFIKFLKKLLISALLIYIISYTFDLNLAQKSANPILKASLNLTDSQTKIAIGCASAIFLIILYKGYSNSIYNKFDQINKYYVENVTGPLILRDIQRNIPVIVESNKKISKFYFDPNNHDIFYRMHFTKEIEKQLSYLYLNHYKFHETVFPVLLASKSCLEKDNNILYRNKFTLEELSFMAVAIRMKASVSVERIKNLEEFEQLLEERLVDGTGSVIDPYTCLPAALGISYLTDALHKEYLGYFNIGFWENFISNKEMGNRMDIISNIIGVYKRFYLPPSPFKNYSCELNDFSNFVLSFNLKLLTVISYPLLSITSFISGIPNPIPRDTFWSIVLYEYDILDSVEDKVSKLKRSINDKDDRVGYYQFNRIAGNIKDYVHRSRFLEDLRRQSNWMNLFGVYGKTDKNGNADFSKTPRYGLFTEEEEKEFEKEEEEEKKKESKII